MAKIVVTGAASGIGEMTVRKLIGEGHSVVGLARAIDGRNKAKAMELEKLGAKFFEADISNESSVLRGIESALGHLKEIDVLINNAAIANLGPIETFSVEEMMDLFNTNLFGTHRVMRAVAPLMRKKGKGLVINVSSTLGRINIPFYGVYSASKWALEALSETYRVELSQFGVEVCLVEPGPFETPIYSRMARPKDTERLKSYGPMNDMMEPFQAGFVKSISDNPEAKPVKVATAISSLISAPHGKRAFRTVVDFTGLAPMITAYNQGLSDLTKGIYDANGLGHLLTAKT